MSQSREKDTLRNNIRRALRLRPGLAHMDDSQAVTQLKKLGVTPGNAQRLMDGDTSPQLSSIAEVARKLGVSGRRKSLHCRV